MSVKLLADENVNFKIVEYLKGKGIDIVSLLELERGIFNYEVIKLAKKEEISGVI